MSQYKLYLHIEGSRDLADFTYIYKSSRQSPNTVQDLAQEFSSAYKREFGRQLSYEAMRLIPETGKSPELDTAVVNAFSSGSDVQVRVTISPCVLVDRTSQAQEVSPSHGVHSLEQLAADLRIDPNSANVAQTHVDRERSEPHGNQASSNTACSKGLLDQQDGKVYLPIIKQFLERAKEAESKKYFRAACKIYEQVECCFVAVGSDVMINASL